MKTIGDRALEHVRRLSADIGCRSIGSAANHAAAEYISEVFQQCSFSIERQEIPVPDWNAEYTSLELNGKTLDAYANTFSPSCDIAAATVPVCTPAELESAAFADRVLVFYGDMAQGELATKGGIYVSERDRRILQLLEERRPAGIITVNPTSHAHWRIIEDFDLDIPSVTVSAQSGLQLLKSPGATVHMKIVAQRSPSHTDNVIGRLIGGVPERIVFCAHYDSKIDTPGAYDNAAGVGVLLTLAELLSQNKHRHMLEFIAFTGEEGAGLGDMAYDRSTGNFDQVTAAINVDGVGPYTGTTTITSFVSSQELQKLLDQQLENFPGVIKVEPWPASDHYIFYSHGTPSLALTSKGIQGIYHTQLDTLDWISADKLAEATQLVLDLFEDLDQKDLSWSRPTK